VTAIARFQPPHRTAKIAIGLAVDLTCRGSGREKAVRAAQWALNRARLDFGYNMRMNGEFALQGWVLDHLPRGQVAHVLDVGANVGEWSRSLLDTAQRRGRTGEVDLHAFEPAASTFDELAKSLGSQAVSLHRVALSDTCGEMPLHITPGTSQCNSLHNVPGVHATHEDVTATTLDAYAQQAGLSLIDLLKIDTEGHDLAVLRGAAGLLREGRIAVAQFEYNEFWIYARRYLRDAFQLLEPLGYQLGKLTPQGVAFYPGWDPGLEIFRGAMYVACRQDAARWLPRVEWQAFG
jgi:FkbM family methyltransferase